MAFISVQLKSEQTIEATSRNKEHVSTIFFVVKCPFNEP